MPILLSHLMPVLLSRLLPTLLSSSVSILLFSVCNPATRSLLPILVSYLGNLTALSFCPMFGSLPTHLISSALKTFKQTLLNKSLYCCLTSPTKFFYLFPTFGLLSKKIKGKRLFDIMFINSCPLTSNYAAKKIDLNFALSKYLVPIKLN